MIPGTSISPLETQQRLLHEVSTAVAAGDARHAFEIATFAIQRGMRHPVLHNARGLWLQQTGQYAAALDEFQRALNNMPQNPTLLNAIGLCLLKLDRLDEAVNAFDAAIALAPDVPHSHYRRGLALANAGDHDAAEAAYERALELDPDFPEALASLAFIAARKNQSEKALALANRALELKPNDGTAILSLAILDMAAKRYSEAEQRMRRLLEDAALEALPRAAVFGLLGDALDGQERYAEAFEVYGQENEVLKREHAGHFQLRAADAAEHMIAYFKDAPAERWRAPDEGWEPPDAASQHVFLLGFMRSGTTLLEQVLGSHSRIVALEEKGLLIEPGERYLTGTSALDALADIGGEDLQRNRRLYWERVRATGADVGGKVFVDKQPLNTVKLPLIAKLFPKAKILFALRDPRDVVFSCFRRHFQVNATMFEFLSLQTSAQFYSSTMSLAELYRQKLPLDLMQIRYEDIVSDFETQVRAICDYIGVEWSEEMRDFNKHAPAVDLRSPSAPQVLKPLYREATAQWRRYADQLAPVLPVLKPWAEKFGYLPD
jgi:Tfp pilus assembly protein PilF